MIKILITVEQIGDQGVGIMTTPDLETVKTATLEEKQKAAIVLQSIKLGVELSSALEGEGAIHTMGNEGDIKAQALKILAGRKGRN